MAIYHLHAKVIQRSKGDTVIGASAYHRAARLYDQKEEKFWDYTNKPHVIYSELLAPATAPDWVKALLELHSQNPSAAAEELWNRTEATENRIDSQLGREIEFALPIELNATQNMALARAFIQDQLVSRGMIADWSVHWDKGNPHVHVLLTMRSLTETGFGHRVREWNSKAFLQTCREKWAEYANFHLHLHQHAVKIDHRSYEAQGIDLIPGIHEGKAARAMASRGIGIQRLEDAHHIRRLNLARLSENAGIVFRHLSTLSDTFTDRDLAQVLGRYVQPKRPQGSFHASPKKTPNVDEVLKHPSSRGASPDVISLEAVVENASVLTPKMIEQILKKISEHESVFTEKDIAKAVDPFIEQADDFAKAVMAVKASSEVIALGVGDDGRDKFTTRRLFDVENDIQQLADVLRERVHLKIPQQQQTIGLAEHEQKTGKTLTDEQKAAVLHLLKPDAIACIVGRAGTGKSFSLGAAKTVWEAQQGVKVHGIALSGIAAEGLSKDMGISSSTIESFTYRIKKGSLTINPLDVIVMDEAGMTDSVSMQAVLKIAEHAKAKLVLVGDPDQLQPVGPGASFRALLERLGFAEMQTVYRQTIPWQRKATVNFSKGEMAEGLAAYQKAGCIHFEATPEDAIEKLIAHWKTLCYEQKVPLHELLVITHRNVDVDTLNQRFRSEQIKAGHLSEGYSVKTKQGTIKIASGDRILLLQTDNRVGVKKGRFATVTFVDFMESGNVINFTAKLDGTGNVVTINPHHYADFTYGYAATVHKAQGATADACLVYAGGTGWNRKLTYVALSRHRHSCHLYADKETYPDDRQLLRRLSRWELKDSVLDFPLAFAERRGIDPEKLHANLPKNLSARLARWKMRLAEQIEGWFRPDESSVRQAKNPQKQAQEIEQITKRREDARVVAAYVDARRDVGMSWQALQAKLTALGLSKLPYKEKDTFEVIQGTAEYIAYQTAQRLRDRKAYDILQAPHRYQKALDIHDVDFDQLKQHAARHRCYENVQEYKRRLQRGSFGVYRDRFALAIMKEIKNHYPALQDAGINTSEHRRQLRTHALSYLRRQCFLTLAAHEKEGFELVEAYQAAAKQAGEWWLKEVKGEESKAAKKPALDALKRLEALGQFRDRLADAILKQIDDCQKALDFYQIGVATAQFGTPPSSEEHRHAQKRWYQLQQQAAYHTARERVASYLKARETNAIPQRLLLAYDILQDTKIHNVVILGLGGDTQGIWRSIRQDARHHTDRLFYRTLDAVDRLGFRDAKRYVEAKKAYTGVWHEFFNQQKIQDPAGVRHIAKDSNVSSVAMQYGYLRNELAVKLRENPALYKKGLDYFGVQPDELDKAAYQHQCHLNVEAYSNATSRLARAEKALAVIADPKAHFPFIQEKNLDWKTIYGDARIAERRQHFDTLNPVEKSHYCLALRYRKTNQSVGKQYAAYKDAKKEANGKLPFSSKLARVFTRRDYLAWRLVNALYEIDPAQLTAFASDHKLNPEKLIQQHAKYTETLTTVKRYPQRLSPSTQRVDTQQLRAALNEQAEAVATHYLGEPKTKQGYSWRYGSNKGSLVVTVQGAKQGLWRDFQLDKGGDMLGLIRHALDTADFKAVLQEATRFLGGNAFYQTSILTKPVSLTQKRVDRNADTKARIQKAQAIYRGTKSILGTVAERYLREHRGILGELDDKTFRYHPNLRNWMTRSVHPALVVVARDKTGQVCGIQAIFLDAETAKKATQLGHQVKLSRGLIGEGAIVHKGKPDGKMALAEGVETALSVAEAQPDWTVVVTFGVSNFAKVRLPEAAKSVMICADNDGHDSGTAKSVARSAEKLSQRGVEVWVAEPQKPDDKTKWDFNDALLAGGVSQVKHDLDEATQHQKSISKEHVKADCEKPLAVLGESASAVETPATEKPLSLSDIKTDSMKKILMRYVEMELEQTRLVNAMHSARLQDTQAGKSASSRALAHAGAIQRFAEEAIQNPEIKTVLETKQKIKSPHLADCGGFIGIHERLQKSKWSDEDIHVLAKQLRNKTSNEARVQAKERSRGGRSK